VAFLRATSHCADARHQLKRSTGSWIWVSCSQTVPLRYSPNVFCFQYVHKTK
jgi:hypothetical protein